MDKAFIVRNNHVIGLQPPDRVYTSTPIGVIQPYASSTTIPNGYLICDGSLYPVSDYPDLYAVIGNTYGGDTENFNVPDYRETVLVGVGENTTDTIADHDVYELGEFKDDQVQGHWHDLGNSNGTVTVSLGASIKGGSIQGATPGGEIRYPVEKALDAITDGRNGEPRTGTTTHGKQKGVTYIIKAFHTNEGADSGVSDDVIEYVEGEIAEVESKVDGLISDTSSATSTYSSAKIDEKYGAYTFGTANATQWLKLTLGNNSKFQPIVISDQYGGKVEIIGMADDGTYKPVKLVRYSYGDWTTYSATDYTTTDQGDANYKIRRLYYYPAGSCYYLEIRQYCTIKVSGTISKPEMVTSLPAETSEMTLIPESQFASKSDLATKQDNLSARKVYVRRNSSANKYVLLATIDMRVLTNLGQPLRIKGVIGNMANDITNIDLTINARNGFVKKILYGTVTHKNFLTNDVNIIITKSDDGKTAYVYLYCISSYAYIDAEIYLGSVHYSVPSTFDLVGTIQGTEYTSLLDSNYVVIENVINDTSTGDTTSTWSSSKIATEIDNAILTKDIIYKGALTANTRKVIATTVGVDLSKIVSISKIFGDTLEGWDYGICQMTNTGELIYMPTATSESSHIQIRIAYRA